MTLKDEVTLVLTAWRENRGGGVSGMQSVMNVICNRSARHVTTVYEECLRKEQFSSITAKGDPELALGPNALDPPGWAMWLAAIDLAATAADGTLPDITGGAVDYYAPKGIKTTARYRLPDGTLVPFPETWKPDKVRYTCTVADQLFFQEV